jgi:hypothetical protein
MISPEQDRQSGMETPDHQFSLGQPNESRHIEIDPATEGSKALARQFNKLSSRVERELAALAQAAGLTQEQINDLLDIEKQVQKPEFLDSKHSGFSLVEMFHTADPDLMEAGKKLTYLNEQSTKLKADLMARFEPTGDLKNDMQTYWGIKGTNLNLVPESLYQAIYEGGDEQVIYEYLKDFVKLFSSSAHLGYMGVLNPENEHDANMIDFEQEHERVVKEMLAKYREKRGITGADEEEEDMTYSERKFWDSIEREQAEKKTKASGSKQPDKKNNLEQDKQLKSEEVTTPEFASAILLKAEKALKVITELFYSYIQDNSPIPRGIYEEATKFILSIAPVSTPSQILHEVSMDLASLIDRKPYEAYGNWSDNNPEWHSAKMKLAEVINRNSM